METPRPFPAAAAGADAPAAGRDWPRSRGGFAVGLLLALAGAALLLVLWIGYWSQPDPDGNAAPAAPSMPAAVQRAPAPARLAPPVRQPAPAPEGDADPTPDLKSYVARGENPSMPEVIARLHQRGVFSGLGAFSPPGTRPPKVGLAVPEEFALPQGYVRHHQATDDGQRIEAILMFAPNFQLYDADHRPVEMPQDRVVPAELAPPGLPIRRIVVPAPREPASAGH